MSARFAMSLAAILLTSPPARADVKVFAVGTGMNIVQYGDTYIGSRDGYHLANLSSDGEHDFWEKDGVELARAPKGVFLHGSELNGGESAAMSADGKVLLHLMAARDSNGAAGVSAALNGKAVGGVYLEIKFLRVSPHGTNIAYAARDASGWSVHSGQGVSPALPDPPSFLFVSDSETVYLTRWQGRMWTYRGGVPSAARNYTTMSATPDLKHLSGVYEDPNGNGHFVDIDGAPSGPWRDAEAPVYSVDGRHAAFLAQSPTGDSVVIDGAPQAATKGADFLLVNDAGTPYWITPPTGDTDFMAYRAGAALKPVVAGHSEWAGFSPSGQHDAFWGKGRLIVDGKAVKAPRPGEEMRIVFDDEKSFHYLTSNFELVCATVDGSPAEKSRCARIGRALDKSRLVEAAQPALPALTIEPAR